MQKLLEKIDYPYTSILLFCIKIVITIIATLIVNHYSVISFNTFQNVTLSLLLIIILTLLEILMLIK